MIKEKLWFGMSLKHFDQLDMALLKLALIAFTLFVVSAWPAFASWVLGMPWVYFLVAWIVFAIRPLIKAFKK